MSLAEYEDFVFAACHVHEEDAASHWRAASSGLGARAAELSGVRELRIVGPDTDLRLSVDGRSWLAADGHYNFPDGEVFTSPFEEESANGHIRFTYPATYRGRAVEGVEVLRFQDGQVVSRFAAAQGADYLPPACSTSTRAPAGWASSPSAPTQAWTASRATCSSTRRSPARCTAPWGSESSRTSAGAHQSALHWDMVADLRQDGEVYADGELIWKNGHFLAEPALEVVESAVGG